jgi:hypothetical protein
MLSYEFYVGRSGMSETAVEEVRWRVSGSDVHVCLLRENKSR